MRLAIDCFHHTVPGGIRTYIDNLLPAMAEESPDDEYVFFYRHRALTVAPPSLPPGTRSKLVHSRAPRRLLSYLENSLGFPRIEVWTGKVDVFHGTHFWLPPTGDARRVLTVHDVTYLRHPEFYADRRVNDYGYRYLLRHSLSRADRVLAISHSTRRDLVELCGVPEDKVWVVPFGADRRFHPAPPEETEELLRRLGIQRPFVIYPVGTFDRRKNLATTLRAFAQAFPAGDRPLLFLSGVGIFPPDISEIVETLGLSGDVRVDSVRYPDDLRSLMSAARWGLYLSLYEGFGLPLLEGMACGLPLLVSNRSAVPEVVGDAAAIVDPADEAELSERMRELHHDDTWRLELSRKGRARAVTPEFSWRRAARQTLAAYRDDRSGYAREPQPLREARVVARSSSRP